MDEVFRFPIGHFSCAAISDGDMNYPLAGLFKYISLDEARAALAERGLPVTHVYSPYTLLFIDTGSHKILVDTGIGKYGEGTKAAFEPVDNSQTRPGIALQSLQAAGIPPEAIDMVLISHAHPDHIGGNFDANGRHSFPNARFLMCREEWNFWFSDERVEASKVPGNFVAIARAELEPLGEKITLIDGDEEFLPGLTAVPLPGHTPGHIGLAVESAGERLMHISDAVLFPFHLEMPGVVAQYDILPELCLATRQRLCDQMANENWLVFAHHFAPFPNLGFIAKKGDGWHWQPKSLT